MALTDVNAAVGATAKINLSKHAEVGADRMSIDLPIDIKTTKHHAYVTVENATSRQISHVLVLHRYSDDQGGDPMAFGPIAPGETAPLDQNVNRANYRTGVATTGRDWWLVTWGFDDGGEADIECRCSDPHNLRPFLDPAEKITHYLAWTVDFVTGGFVEELPGWLGAVGIKAKWLEEVAEAETKVKKLKKVAGVLLCATVIAKVTNTQKTSADGVNMKQHILRKGDANKTTTIRITKSGNVEFVSPSGRSTTGSKSVGAVHIPEDLLY